ncbi:hypothetical protein K3495_g608 [Podosphaera aphanis]|nr:hypothetical protein K3495_g608 [Podosphaera aphanis]
MVDQNHRTHNIDIVISISILYKKGNPDNATLSNNTSLSTGLAATQVMYGDRIREPIDIAADSLSELEISENFTDSNTGNQQKNSHTTPAVHSLSIDTINIFPIKPKPSSYYRPAIIDASDAIKWATMVMKERYDSQHQPIFYNVGDYVSLCLHRGYQVAALKDRNVRIEQRFAGPFKVIERISKLAYCIELPPLMSRIHNVVSVAYLEPAPDPSKDPFKRPSSQNILSDLAPSKILRKRQQNRRDGGKMTEYLVRYLHRTAEWDKWILANLVPRELVQAFEIHVEEKI